MARPKSRKAGPDGQVDDGARVAFEYIEVRPRDYEEAYNLDHAGPTVWPWNRSLYATQRETD